MYQEVDVRAEVESARRELRAQAVRPSLKRVVSLVLSRIGVYNQVSWEVQRLNNHLPLGSRLDDMAEHHCIKILERLNGT